APAEHERSVDVEQKDGFQIRSALAAYVAGPGPFRGGFLVEADALAFVVQIVAELQRQPVLAGRELHVDFRVAFAEMDPRRRALDDRLCWLQASGVDADVIVANSGTGRFHVAFGHRGNLVVLDAELQVDRALHRRAVLWLDEEDARLALRLDAHRGRQAESGGRGKRCQGEMADNSHDESPLFNDAHSGPCGTLVQPADIPKHDGNAKTSPRLTAGRWPDLMSGHAMPRRRRTHGR